MGLTAPDSVGTNLTFKLPATDGSAAQVLKTDGSGGLGWATVATIEETITSAGPGTNQTIGDTDEAIHVVTPTASIDYTLDNTYSAGRVLTLINLATAYDITVKANDGSTIFTLYRGTRNQVACQTTTPTTNTSWRVIQTIETDWYDNSAGFTPSAGFGTVSAKAIYQKRVGDTLYVRGSFIAGTVAATDATMTLPYDIDFGKTDTQDNYFGHANNARSAVASAVYAEAGGYAITGYSGDGGDDVFFCRSTNSGAYVSTTGSASFNTGSTIPFTFSYPVSGWTSYTG